MTTLAIILAALLLIALLRFGVSVEYSESGLNVTVQVGPLPLQILPGKEKPISAEKAAKLKARKEEKARKKAEEKAKKKAEKKTEEKKPGTLKTVLELLPAVKTVLGRLRHRLLIKKLVVYFTVSSEDPFSTAQTFGVTNAAIGAIIPVFENNFRIKQREFRTESDFISAQQSIYVNAAISLAVWEAVYIAMAILFTGIRIILSTRGTTDRKDVHENGQNADS